MADEPNFYDRLDEILDDCRAGHKQNDIVDALDALYGEQHAVTIVERDEARAEVERLRDERDELEARLDSDAVEARETGHARAREIARLRHQLGMHLTAWRNARDRARLWRGRAVKAYTTLAEARQEAEKARADAANQREFARDGHAIAEQASVLHRDARAELEQWHATFGETALRDGLARMARAEAENGRLRRQLAMHLTAWRNARRGRAEARAENAALVETVAAADADRDRLERDVTFLTEIVVGTVLLGADDTIGMVRALAEHVAASGELSADQVERVTAGLDKQQADRDRLAERMAAVEKFVAARAQYITSINNCHPDNSHDYWRWQGHAEGRRQLAQELGLPVAWPPEYERDATEPGA